MKKTLLKSSILAIILVISGQIRAQIDCSVINYIDVLFADDIAIDTIQFAEKFNPTTSSVQTLEMNVYYAGVGAYDTKRPLVMISHGGAFIQGNKESMDTVARIFASRGYIAVTHDYRLTNALTVAFAPIRLIETAAGAVDDLIDATDAMKDMADSYDIDTSSIIYVGGSAGGIMALHRAYVDRDDSFTDEIATIFEDNTPLLERPSDADDVLAVVNLSGAILDTSWLKNNNVPVYSYHGDMDGTVPYGAGNAVLVIPMFGSGAIHPILDEQGVENYLYTVVGGDHQDVYDDPQYRDDLDSFLNTVVIGMADLVCDLSTSVAVTEGKRTQDLVAYPNPFLDQVTISSVQKGDIIRLVDMTGRVIHQQAIDVDQAQLSLDIAQELNAGTYLLHIEGGGANRVSKLIKAVAY